MTTLKIVVTELQRQFEEATIREVHVSDGGSVATIVGQIDLQALAAAIDRERGDANVKDVSLTVTGTIPPGALPSRMTIMNADGTEHVYIPLAQHDTRVTELLEANNREVDRRRLLAGALRSLLSKIAGIIEDQVEGERWWSARLDAAAAQANLSLVLAAGDGGRRLPGLPTDTGATAIGYTAKGKAVLMAWSKVRESWIATTVMPYVGDIAIENFRVHDGDIVEHEIVEVTP